MDVIVRSKTLKPTVVPQPAPQFANPPITREVVLMCEACRAPRLHKFVITRRAGMSGHEQIYGCTCCRAERRYGLI